MKTVIKRSFGLLLALCPFVLSAQITKADYQRADTVVKNNNLVYSPAINATWIGDTHEFWYMNHERRGDIYYLVDAKTGKKRTAFDQQKLAAILTKESRKEASATSMGLASVQFKEDKSGIMFEYNNTRWEYLFKKNILKKLEDKEGQPRGYWGERRHPANNEPVISPDKQWEAFINDYNVYIRPIGGKEVIALSFDGNKELYYSPFIQWSPDSKKLATLKIRDVQVRRIPLIESSPESQLQPILQWRDYAKPGDVLPISLPVLFDLTTKKQIQLDTDPFANQFSLYITGWRKDSRAFTFEFNQRGHQRYIVGEVDAQTGEITHLADEQSPTFIHYYNNYRYDLNDGKEMIWSSERDGWRHLYLFNDKGNVKRQITKGEWVVRKVEYVDEKDQTIYFMASGFNKGEDPYNLHYCRIKLDGTGFEDLTPEPANHRITPSKDRTWFVDVYSRPDLPPVSQLKRTVDASIVAELEKCDITDLLAKGWKMPEVFCAKGRDGKTDIWGNIHRPSTFDPSKSYPVIEMIYAGPHDSHVVKDFLAYNRLISRVCELGFIVVSIDGMGTANRSKAFHDVCWKNLKDAGYPDRIAWIKAAAAEYPYIDTERVGVYGWSAGGQNAMAALLFYNDFYKVAVALCGCHDNRVDKMWWNEQWMGYPIDESYSACSNVDNAHLLKGKLLLINGELDDNVDPASTLQVVNALVKANKNFEQLYLPGRTHSLGGPYEMHRLDDFFVKHLYHQETPVWD
ncbi:MAG: DPP IV N-terminal domain-containing protein [Massilibacteroides sp.]|nr:DPP IV N-terminal domain-containing protein [Massilibacteroides sp.]MDD3062122.1 DPP IV N-terminal domain-containing protein [Massilibacteroides sp.]MDD4114698.1 DPP IV N-terminal domain-containing protein [Massilibacteroides sp.]MDD4660317.1 DPP IV N-terminal domain-containing protein [Massilibacteroides sp.]